MFMHGYAGVKAGGRLSTELVGGFSKPVFIHACPCVRVCVRFPNKVDKCEG